MMQVVLLLLGVAVSHAGRTCYKTLMDKSGDSITASKGNSIGTVDVQDVMIIEMTVSIGVLNSSPSELWESVLHIGNTNSERYPGIWFHSAAGTEGNLDGFTLSYGTTSNWNPWQDITAAGNKFTNNQVVSYKSIQTQDRLTIIQDGQTLYDGAWNPHPLASAVNVYVGDPWYEPADITITNLMIKTEESCSKTRRGEPIVGYLNSGESSGQTVTLTCKRGINAIAAIYGANCRRGDQGSLPGGERQDGPMKEECYGKTSCDYTIDHTEIGDPCSGTVKDFYYAYTCTGNKYGVNVGSLGISEASGQSFTISCEGDDMVIKVADAIYGLNCQITPRVCGASAGLAYGTSASPLDVTDDLKTECNGKSSCTYNINHGKLGDPCSCVVKDYVYTYQCVPPRLVTMDEYEDMEADIDDIVDYELVVAHGIEEGQVNMMTLFINQTSIYVKAVVIFVGLLAVYGLYKLFADKLKNKLNSNGEYQRLLNQV
mmetsp:Transcript_73207/g.65897  ORF Transcript_73207/g.65897 Transcript_73207/m.65897 type:complete len:486 (-) Transcript_73207:44-1501(-)